MARAKRREVDMEHIRQAGMECALRACGFGSLGIFCVMFGLSFDPALALKTGGVLTAMMTVALILKSQLARTQPYRRTEMWLRLPKEQRPPEATAQQVISTVLREIYLMLALWSAGIAAVFLLISGLF